MVDRTAVAESVARACTASAGTVQALAQEVGVSYAALCSWSRGRRQPPAHRLRKLADVLEARAQRMRELAVELRAQAAPRTEPDKDEGLRFPVPVTGPSAEPSAARRAWAASGPDRSSAVPLSAR
jgi:transcriptional regulator with XRE-family HTH domain